MTSYLDIELLGDAECNVHHVRGALFERFHLFLVQSRERRVGVSFPKFVDADLGSAFRFHGDEVTLDSFARAATIGGTRDYIRVGAVSDVPLDVRHRQVSRAQSKSSPERLRRRLQKRHNLSPAEAMERIPDSAQSFLDLPFVMMRSGSSQQHFRLFLRHGPLLDTPVGGDFNSYGLSAGATIPWF